MKKSDIVIGQEYARNDSKYGPAQRVRVLGDGLIQQGWGYNRRTVTGTKVLLLNNISGEPLERAGGDDWIETVANREIREPWSDYAERNAAIARARRESRNRERLGRERRVEMLLDLIPALRNAGFIDSETSIHDGNVLAAMKGHVDDRLERDGYGSSKVHTFRAPLASALKDYVNDGSPIPIHGADLLRILKAANR